MNDTSIQPLVLIADDDDMTRSLMSAALAEHDFETIEVGNGKDAVKLIPRLNPDLVILDVQMPEMDGFSACEAIRATASEPAPPIVIVTGSDDTVSVERAFDVGATDFISKPVNWSLLGHRMRYILRGAQTRDTLARREAENNALLEALPDRLAVVDRAGNILNYLTRDEQEIERYSHGSLDDLLPRTNLNQVLTAIRQVMVSEADQTIEVTGEIGLHQQTGIRHYEIRITPQAPGMALLILRDVTTRKQAEERIHQLAFFDSLTALPNRHHFLHLTHQELVSNPNEQFALFQLDIDQFRRINETLGNDAGDQVLTQVAERLQSLAFELTKSGRNAQCARLGSNEFALLAPFEDKLFLSAISSRLNALFATPINSGRHELIVTASVGMALFPDDAADSNDLHTYAAHALQTSKQAGGNILTLYADCHQNASHSLLELEMDLRRAIENDELTPYFQPKYNLARNTLAGAELLLRWFHPRHGAIPPNTFIPLAEQSGLIVDIDRWVTDCVCAHLSKWQEAGLNPAPISINISGRAFSYDKPATTLARALSTHQVDPELLEIEITETVLMADPQTATATLTELKNMGIRLAIDDFGTGYSSLSYLKQFPLDTLKIDRAFVTDLEHDENDRALCHAMVTMAHSLGLNVVAEGIETEYQRTYLRSIGCELAQGYLLDKPMPAEEFAEVLSANRNRIVHATQAMEQPKIRH